MEQAQSKLGCMEAAWNADVMNTLVKAILYGRTCVRASIRNADRLRAIALGK